MPLPDIPPPHVPPQHVRRAHPYAAEARRHIIDDIKARFPDLEEALDQLAIMSRRFGGRNSHRIEHILLFIEDSILLQIEHLSNKDLADTEAELVKYNTWLKGCFEQDEDGKSYEDIVSNLKKEQAQSRTFGGVNVKGESMIAWILNKEEDEGYPTPWKHDTTAPHTTTSHPSSSTRSLGHRLTSRQKKIYNV